jgi:hypothetical protein
LFSFAVAAGGEEEEARAVDVSALRQHHRRDMFDRYKGRTEEEIAHEFERRYASALLSLWF